MNLLTRTLTIALLSLAASMAVAAPTPFKTTFDELLSEFPNFEAEIKPVPPTSEGKQRRAGAVVLGNGLLMMEAEGATMDALEEFTVGYTITGATTAQERQQLDDLSYSFIRKLARSDKGYWQTKAYFTEDLTRQFTVLKAGGTPKPNRKVFGNTELRVRLVKGDGDLTVLYLFKRLG
ncbi:hypothetical protein [Stutzerimonas balearica]|uniref:hypothetical protein n=1 Tax=Stutzerimonas balearica TaxID=74829 RepID=UPI00190CA103|nr:hypothetical protein [Stutzerimonas balearica]MBK3748249.1 hypothetical protein [Stutzerimonas balearica]MBK3826446.1 hypothetical protein [Stutzerimonas balearica]MBK3856136.1 hypothetical protein [Stutzerimonas balearica]